MARYHNSVSTANTVNPDTDQQVNITNKENEMTETTTTQAQELENREELDAVLDNVDPDEYDDTDEDYDDEDYGDDEGDEDEYDDTDEGDTLDQAAEKAAKKKADRAAAEKAVAEFGEYVTSIVEAEADLTVGSLPEDTAAKAVEAYQALSGIIAKNMARDWVEQQMMAGVDAGDLPRAKVYMELGPQLKASAKRAATPRVATPADPRDQIPFLAARVAELDLARQLIEFPAEVEELEDSSEEIANQATDLYNNHFADTQEYMAYLKDGSDEEDTEPEVPDFVKNAARLALGLAVKAKNRRKNKTGGERAPRRNPRAHIDQVFADKPVGTFMKVGEIAAAASEEYGTDRPSPGAITSNLNNEKFADAAIQPAEKDGMLGGIKKR